MYIPTYIYIYIYTHICLEALGPSGSGEGVRKSGSCDTPTLGAEDVIIIMIVIIISSSSSTMISMTTIICIIAHQKSTPQKSSWIFSGIFQWISVASPNGFQRYSPKDCHSPSGLSLDASNRDSLEPSKGISL